MVQGKAPATPSVMRLRWLMLSLLALAYLIVLFQRIAPGVVADRLMAEFVIGGAAVGALTSIYFYLYALMQIPAGVLADTLGARKTVAIGALLAGAGSLVFGLAPGLEVAYLGRFLVGLGVSVIFVATLKFQVNWFRAAEFGTVSGLLLVVGNLGAIGGTTPVAMMAESLGWRATFIVIGAIHCVLGVAVFLWVRDHPPDLGLLFRRGPEQPSEKRRAASGASAAKRPLLAGAGILWRSRQVRAGVLAQFGLLGAHLAFVGLWAVPYLMHVYGMDRSVAASYLAAGSAATLVSGPLCGYVSDRLGQRRLPIVALGILACVCWLALTFWNGGRPPVWALYPIFAAIGFSCATVTLILAAVKESNPPDLSGLAMGAANASFLSAAVLQPALGYLLDTQWQGVMLAGARVYPASAYQMVLGILTVLALVGLAGAWLMVETYCRNTAEAAG